MLLWQRHLNVLCLFPHLKLVGNSHFIGQLWRLNAEKFVPCLEPSLAYIKFSISVKYYNEYQHFLILEAPTGYAVFSVSIMSGQGLLRCPHSGSVPRNLRKVFFSGRLWVFFFLTRRGSTLGLGISKATFEDRRAHFRAILVPSSSSSTPTLPMRGLSAG